VRWGVAGNIAIAWVLTLPAAGLTGAAVYGFASIFGSGSAGPLIVAVLLIAGLIGLSVARVRQAANAASAANAATAAPTPEVMA
jgi:PiT family inorganic phosphate transporter